MRYMFERMHVTRVTIVALAFNGTPFLLTSGPNG